MTEQQLIETALRELCNRVDADYDKIISTCNNQWPVNDYLWTQDEEDDFRAWLTKHFRKKIRTKKLAEREAGWFVLMYGWRTA
jgi:hypothetical protein